MNFVSAYLIMQKADADDPFHPKQEEEPKSWFKRLFQEHPMDFPQYMGVDIDLDEGRLVTRTQNVNRTTGEVIDNFEYTLTSIEDIPSSPGYWVTKGNGDYISPGMLDVFHDVNYYTIMNGSTAVTMNGSGTKVYNGSSWTEGTRLSNMATVGDYEENVGFAIAKLWAYAIPCKIKVPVFTNSSDGAAYSTAANAYYQNPTQANYETLCSYIDLCDNPDG